MPKLKVYVSWWVCNTITAQAFGMKARGSKDRDKTRVSDCGKAAGVE